MKDVSLQSSRLSISHSPIVLVVILGFLAFIPLSNYAYGDTTYNASNQNATKLWQFSSQGQNSTTVSSTEIENKSIITSLDLVGGGYLTIKDNSTRNLSALTLSAWVKPDYSQ